MKKTTIGILLKIAIIMLGITGLLCCLMMGRILEYILPGFSGTTHSIWLYSLYFCALPCFVSLAPAWIISTNIAKKRAFSPENATFTKHIGYLMAGETLLVALTNTLMLVTGRSYFALFLSFSLIIAIFLAVSICAFVLSSLLENASVLQNQSDYTI
ncbi:MAG: DUF2975 domain-containing protein [Eubacterium sp.]|nr:DUF2975 domain-containing protein [Eubacterium sp.]